MRRSLDVVGEAATTGSTKRAKHGDALLERMESLKATRLLCDVVLRAEERTFHVHRVVMASCSDYFRSMFTGGMRETAQQEIELKGVSAKGIVLN